MAGFFSDKGLDGLYLQAVKFLMMKSLKLQYALFFLLINVQFVSCKKDAQNNNSNNNNNNTPPTEYTYTQREVKFQSDTFHLHGTFYEPVRKDPAPAIVIVAGSGNINRYGQVPNDTNAIPPIYRIWAQYFAKKGYAVLLYDKRYITYPNINILAFSEDDQIKDAESAADFVSTQSTVNPSNIFLVGHSEGGNLVTVAATHKTYIKKVAVLNAVAFSVDTLFVEQLKASGQFSSSQIKQVQDAFKMVRDGSFPQNGQIFGAGKNYWGQWIDYSARAGEIAGGVQRPVFVINGDKDENFPGDMLNKNINAWKSASVKYKNITFTEVPGLTHLLLMDGTRNTDENVLSKIAGFLQ